MLNKLRYDFLIGENVWHSEVFHFHQKPAGQISQPRYFVDQNEWQSKIGCFQCCTSGSNNSNPSALHDFGRLTNCDFEQLRLLTAIRTSNLFISGVQISPSLSLR